MTEIKQCPICKHDNILVEFDNRFRRFNVFCAYCDKEYIILNKKTVKCPECESDNIAYSEDETNCRDCGLVLATTIEYNAGIKINLPWGRK